MHIIDMQRIRDGLPKHARVVLKKRIMGDKSVVFIQCNIGGPTLCEMYPLTFEQDFDMIKDWQRDIVGEALSEFYTEETGSWWYIYLKRIPIDFINLTDDDVKGYSGYTVEQLRSK